VLDMRNFCTSVWQERYHKKPADTCMCVGTSWASLKATMICIHWIHCATGSARLPWRWARSEGCLAAVLSVCCADRLWGHTALSFNRVETVQSLERLKREARTLELRVEFKLNEFARMDSGSMAVVDPEAGGADQERVHIKEIEDYLLQVG